MKKNLVLGAVFAAAVWVLWRGEASPVLFRRFWL